MEQFYSAISWYCIIVFFVAPQVYPWNVTGFNVSSTAIYLQWSPIPPEMVAGILREYRIVLDELTYDNVPIRRHTIRLSSDNLFVNLTGLSKYRNYTIELQGISKFFGVSSPPIIIITDEDGKKHVHEYAGKYSLLSPVRGNSARKGCLFEASGIWKGRDLGCWSIWKGGDICHLGN